MFVISVMLFTCYHEILVVSRVVERVGGTSKSAAGTGAVLLTPYPGVISCVSHGHYRPHLELNASASLIAQL